jgi:hypothetical protein
MILIDSLKIKFPNKYLNNKLDYIGNEENLFPVLLSVKDKKFNKNILTVDSNGEIKGDSKVFTSCGSFGLKSIQVSPAYTIIELSAKILKEDYYDLINYKNFDKVIDAINSSGEITIDAMLFKLTAQILKVDITNNIEMNSPKEVKEVIRDFGTLASGRKFRVTNYEQGLEIISQHQTNRERLIIYPKFQELTNKTKINKELSKYINIDKFKNVVRIESNFKNFNSIRKYFKTETTGLQYVDKLNNSEEIQPAHELKKNSITYYEPVHKAKPGMKLPISLENIIGEVTNINLRKVFNMFNFNYTSKEYRIQNLIDSGIKLYQIEKTLGRIQLIEFYKQDINSIRKFLQTTVKGNISKYLKDYELLINDIKLNNIKPENKIDLFIERLKNAS